MGSDQLIRRKRINRYVFADVVVERKDAQIEPGAVEALNDPVVVFEVLSPSTELMDRKTKFVYYSSFESLKELVLVHQAEKLVEHFHRESVQEEWRVAHLFEDEDELVLSSVGSKLSVAEIYESVEW
jgi:Uma2 family endonuclease